MIIHKPVLLKEVLDFIPNSPKLIIDGTLGHGGHSLEMLKKLNPDGALIGLDIDGKILEKAQKIIAASLDTSPSTLHLVHDSYANITKILSWKKADYILLDIWVNLEHFKDGSRGFSIKENADLDMRFDQNAKQSDYNIIADYRLPELANIFMTYGDFTEKKAKELAEAIIRERNKHLIKTTYDLKKILNECWLGDKACAVIFQCVRIETNQEIQNLKVFLGQLPEALSQGGRCAIISYHSIEDRLVKTYFKQLEETKEFHILTPKTVQPHYTEIEKNKAARSAKLRVIERT